MFPESKFIKSEIIVREMALSDDAKLTKKSLIRWIALSLGLITQNESRTIVFDVLEALMNFHIKKIQPSTQEIIEEIKYSGANADEKSIYYHLLKMKEMGLIQRKKGKYFFGEFGEGKLAQIIKKVYRVKFENAFGSIEEALNAIENYNR